MEKEVARSVIDMDHDFNQPLKAADILRELEGREEINVLKQKLDRLKPDEIEFAFSSWPRIIGATEYLREFMKYGLMVDVVRQISIIIKKLDLAVEAYQTAPRIPGTQIRVIAQDLNQEQVAWSAKRLGLVIRKIIRMASPRAYLSIIRNRKVFSVKVDAGGSGGGRRTPGLINVSIILKLLYLLMI